MRTPGIVTLALLVALGAAAGAQVDCSDPDNLCTGDPCVIPVIEPASPCVVAFPGELIIEGLRNVENVDFSALKITVAGSVKGRRGTGGQLALRSSGDLDLNGPIQFDGESSITLDAIDRITQTAPIRMSGGDDTPVDSILSIHAQSPISLQAPIVNTGGADAVEIGSFEGINVSDITNRRRGAGPQPSLLIGGSRINLNGTVSADGPVDLSAENDIEVREPIRVGGPHLTIDVAEAPLTVEAPITSTGRANGGRCGAITLRAGKGVPIVDAPIVCAGRAGGDGIRLSGDSIRVNSTLKTVSKDETGGDIVLEAGGSFGVVTVTGDILARGSRPGDVVVDGQTISFEDATVKSSSRLGGGAQRYTATDGDILLQGTFNAAKGGTIQATATGNVTTDGAFAVGTGGCIGLSAGGSVSLGSSIFDQTPTTSCP